jgi:hypothetical protein
MSLFCGNMTTGSRFPSAGKVFQNFKMGQATVQEELNFVEFIAFIWLEEAKKPETA